MRLGSEAVRRVADGHPWIFHDALKGRELTAQPGDTFEVVDANGNFVACAVFDPQGPIALRAYTWRSGSPFGAESIRRAVSKAAQWRRRLCDCGPDRCLRVLNGDSEAVPATNVDRYGDFLVISVYGRYIERWVDALVEALAGQWSPRGVYLQRRYQGARAQAGNVAGGPRPGAQLVHGAAAPPEVLVREGRAWFAVDVTAPLGTGLFVDMRMGRQIVAELAAGRRVLNCFSYTGAFSVVAGLHGAAEVVSVDSAARAHARARHNLTLNGLVTEQSTRFEFVTGDAMASLTRWASRKRQFDLVVLDPPTFATAKGRTFTALRDYAELTASAVSVLAPGGLLCAASNAAKLSQEDFERAIGRGAVQAQRTAAVVQRSGQPEDFPVLPAFGEGRYLKFVTVRVD